MATHTPKHLRPTRVGGISPKKRRPMAVSLPPPVRLPQPMLRQYGHFRLKGSPKRKNFEPKKQSPASVDRKVIIPFNLGLDRKLKIIHY